MASRYIIYGRSSCPFCVAAVDLLKFRDIESVFLDLDDSPDQLNEAKQFYDWPTVPIILKNDLDTGEVSLVGGYTDLEDTVEP